jgi:hypothetical protein
LPDDYAVCLRIFDGFVYRWQNWTLTISEPVPPDTPGPRQDVSAVTLLIMLAVIGFGAFVVFRRVTEHKKPAKKPEKKERKK